MSYLYTLYTPSSKLQLERIFEPSSAAKNESVCIWQMRIHDCLAVRRLAHSVCNTAPVRKTRSVVLPRRVPNRPLLLVMPAGYPRRLANYYPNYNSTLNTKHVTKWSEPLTMGRAFPEEMRRAFFQLRNGRPGPVQIEIPVDLFNEDVPDNWEYIPSYATRSAPDPQAVDEAAAVLSAAERPVIYAGQGVHYAEAWPQLNALAEEWQIPVTTGLEGKSSFPETHELSLGSGGRANPRTVKTFLAEADVILGIGCSFALTGFGVQMPRGKTIIHATLDPMDLNKDVPAQYALIGDAQLTLNALLDSLQDRDHSNAEARRGTVAKRISQPKQE